MLAVWVGVGLISVSTFANNNNNNQSAQLSAPMDETKEESSKFSGYAVYDHYVGFREDVDTSGIFYFSGSYKANVGTFEVFQAVNKYYAVDPGAPEVEAADTQLRHYTKSLELSDKWKFQVRSELTVPISNFSREQDVITKPSVQGRFNTSLLGDAISISLRPYYRYYVNTYKTTVSGVGDGGGRPLRLWQAGASALVSWEPTERLGFLATFGYERVKYEEVRFYNANPVYGESDFPQHRYLYSLSTEYYFIPETWSLGVGYSHDSLAEQRGGVEYTLYDDMISTWNVTTSVFF